MFKTITALIKGFAHGYDDTKRSGVTDIAVDNQGRIVNYPYQFRDGMTTGLATLANGTKTSLVAAGGAGIYNDLVMLYGSNTSSGAITVTILDESTTVDSFSVAASATFNRKYDIPLTQSGANVAWYVDLADDNNSTVTVNAWCVKNK